MLSFRSKTLWKDIQYILMCSGTVEEGGNEVVTEWFSFLKLIWKLLTKML